MPQNRANEAAKYFAQIIGFKLATSELGHKDLCKIFFTSDKGNGVFHIYMR